MIPLSGTNEPLVSKLGKRIAGRKENDMYRDVPCTSLVNAEAEVDFIGIDIV